MDTRAVPWEPSNTIDRVGQIWDQNGALISTERYESNLMVKIGDDEYSLAVVLATIYMLETPTEDRFLAFIDRDVFNVTVDNLQWTDEKDAAVQLSLLPLEIKIYWMIERCESGIQVVVYKRSEIIHKKLTKDQDREALAKYYWTGSNGKLWSNRRRIFLKTNLVGGYPAATIYTDSSYLHVHVHRMVATSFLINPNPETNHFVNHISGNKEDPSASNLEWVSSSQNSSHSANVLGKISNAVPVIRTFPEDNPMKFRSIQAAAKFCGIDCRGILRSIKENKIVNGYMWSFAKPRKIREKLDIPVEEHVPMPESPYLIYPTLGKVFNTRVKNWVTVHTNPAGYQYIGCTINKKLAIFYLHTLIATTVYGPIPPGYCVNHKDLNPSNNVADNLEIVTRQQNTRHYVEHTEAGTNQSVISFDPQNMRIIIFGNCRDAGDFYGLLAITPGNILATAKGTKSQAKGIYFCLYDEGESLVDCVNKLDAKLIGYDRPVESLRKEDFGTRWPNMRKITSPPFSLEHIINHCRRRVETPLFRFISLNCLMNQITLWSFDPKGPEKLIRITDVSV